MIKGTDTIRFIHKHEIPAEPIQFVLVVDNFGIKYLRQEDLDHIVWLLEKHYNVTVDLDGKKIVKIRLDWGYENKKVHVSIVSYLQKALQQFNNIIPTQRHNSPYPYIDLNMGQSGNLPNMTRVLLLVRMSKICSAGHGKIQLVCTRS